MGYVLAVIAGVSFLLLLFMALRAVMLWYWKVDVALEALTNQAQALQYISKTSSHQAALLSVIAGVLASGKEIAVVNKTTGVTSTIGISGLNNIDLTNHYIEVS